MEWEPAAKGAPSARIHIRPAMAADPAALARCDFSFTVSAEATGPFDRANLGPVVPVEPTYTKRYGFSAADLTGYLKRIDRALFVAEADGQAIGYLAVVRDWHHHANIDDLAVDAAFRGRGVADRLMDAAKDWAVRAGLPGLRLETQSTNIAACRFYERYGFQLGGHDRRLYQALHPGTRDVALFWYLPFTVMGQRTKGSSSHPEHPKNTKSTLMGLKRS